MSTWLFDLGNSRLKCVPLQPDGTLALAQLIEIAHDGTALPDGWIARLPEGIDVAFVASVAGDALGVSLLDALTQRCPRIVRARTQSVCAGVRIAYAQPARLGV